MIEARIVKRYAAARESAAFTLDVDITTADGITVLFGPSGSGKTLTLDCIAGFAQPGEGRILIDDSLMFDGPTRVHVRPQDRQCGYVFQNYALFPHMTLRDNLMFAAAGLAKTNRHRTVNEMLDRFRLAEVAGRKPHEISGGQKQRGSIARALVANPRVLLLDEPARGLDAPLRQELYDILRQVRAEFETPIILVTHSLDECFELADDMIVLRDGRVAQCGTPAEIAARPASVDLARLLGIFNIIPVEIRALDPSRNTSVLRWGDYEIQSEYYPGHLKGDHVHLLATPKQLHAAERLGRLSANQVPVQLRRAVPVADAVRLEFAEGLEVEVRGALPNGHNGDWMVEFPARGLRIL